MIGRNFQVLRYFSYTSVVTERLATYCEDGIGREEEGSVEVQMLFEDACKKASESSDDRRDWMDNKCAFEILIKGRILYVGYYDGKYSLGLGISGIGGNRVYDFITRTWLTYGENNA